MRWYDVFSGFYDRSLEPLYREQRKIAADLLAPEPGHLVMDLPCGTGQSFEEIAPRLDPSAGGALLGVDLSAGMLRHANERVTSRGWTHVHLLEHDALTLDANAIANAVGGARPLDRLQVFLGLTAFPDWERAFEGLWNLLAPGGRCIVVDVHAAKLGLQGHMVNLVARADIRRETWTVLERLAEGYERHELPSLPQHGGQMFAAVGNKPA